MLSKALIAKTLHNAGLTVELPTPIPTDVCFSDLGLDSLDVYNVFLELEGLTGIKIPDSDIDALQSIDSIHDYFATRE